MIPPSRLYRKGRLNKKLFDEILSATRDPEEREGDLRAQLGSLEVGIKEARPRGGEILSREDQGSGRRALVIQREDDERGHKADTRRHL